MRARACLLDPGCSAHRINTKCLVSELRVEKEGRVRGWRGGGRNNNKRRRGGNRYWNGGCDKQRNRAGKTGVCVNAAIVHAVQIRVDEDPGGAKCNQQVNGGKI